MLLGVSCAPSALCERSPRWTPESGSTAGQCLKMHACNMHLPHFLNHFVNRLLMSPSRCLEIFVKSQSPMYVKGFLKFSNLSLDIECVILRVNVLMLMFKGFYLD